MEKKIHEAVKERYGNIASSQTSCCSSSCCDATADEQAKRIGYSDEELQSLPEGANLSLGCGNPLAHAEIKPGDTVLDLGSGAGIDCFLAAKEVGTNGFVIGVDMTPEMIEKANQNREKVGLDNIDFRLGHIEDLPVESNSVDVVISNCVINLSPNKQEVFQEAFRVLKPGGVLMISDIVLLKKLPRIIRKSVDAYVGCIAGAAKKEDYIAYIHHAGFTAIDILEERQVSDVFPEDDPIIQKVVKRLPLSKGKIKRMSGNYAESIKVRAVKSGLELVTS